MFDLTDKVVLVTGGGGLLGKMHSEVVVENGGKVIIGDINIEQRGSNEIVVAKTVEISNNLSKDKKEIKEFSAKIKDDLTIDLLAQFSEALRKKYKITINDDVINQLN